MEYLHSKLSVLHNRSLYSCVTPVYFRILLTSHHVCFPLKSELIIHLCSVIDLLFFRNECVIFELPSWSSFPSSYLIWWCESVLSYLAYTESWKHRSVFLFLLWFSVVFWSTRYLCSLKLKKFYWNTTGNIILQYITAESFILFFWLLHYQLCLKYTS